MTNLAAQREDAILPEGLEEGVGHFVPLLLSRQPIQESSFDARSVDAAIQNLHDALRRPGTPNLLTLAKLLGAGYFVGTVDSASDSSFPHDLGRTPVLVVHSIDISGGAGQVLGNAEGGTPNATRWSSSTIYVRSTVTGRYAFFVI